MAPKALKWIVGLVIFLSLLSAVGLAFLRTYHYSPPLKVAAAERIHR
jgi:hypothetical protein